MSVPGFLEGGGFEKWFAELGIGDSPAARSGLQVALPFFHHHMPKLDRNLMVSFLKAMDLSKPVTLVTLREGEEVIAYSKPNQDPFKFFFARPGTSWNRLGINPEGRHFFRYRLRISVTALQSFAGTTIDTWTNRRAYFDAAGGGRQLIIPNSIHPLEIVHFSDKPTVAGPTRGSSSRPLPLP